MKKTFEPKKLELIDRINPEVLKKGTYFTSLSLVEGCTPASDGCANCWKAGITYRFKSKTLALNNRYDNLTHYNKPSFNGNIKLIKKDLYKPVGDYSPKLYSVYNDLFHEKVSNTFIYDVFDQMAQAYWHTFIVLTKRPKRMREFLRHHIWMSGDSWNEFQPGNIIIGTSVENQVTADERLPELLSIPAKCRMVSFEPLLEKIDISRYVNNSPQPPVDKWQSQYCDWCGINWAILGAESGPKKRYCPTDNFLNLYNQLENCNDIAIFVKQLHERKKQKIIRLIKDIKKFPIELQRREFPSLEFLMRD